jgi:hypothetical protein
METMVSNSSKAVSKTKTVLAACALAAFIAFTITVLAEMNFHEFFKNIMDWNSI